MKKIITLNILILLLLSCVSNEKNKVEHYIEKQTSFAGLNKSKLTENLWIRNPMNLKIVHESLKKFGYKNLEHLIFKSDNEFLIRDIYIKRNFDNVLDSLLLTYNSPEIETKFYVEFWNRRKAERNDSIVYEIIREINSLKSDKKQLQYEDEFVNDTLVDLMRIEFGGYKPHSKNVNSEFYALKKYGLHQSAYNLLYERNDYSRSDSDRKKLKKELTTTSEYTNPWLIDTSK